MAASAESVGYRAREIAFFMALRAGQACMRSNKAKICKAVIEIR
jgi:hypothetical protein